MKNTVLMSILSVAGLAASAQAQQPGQDPNASYQAVLVLDNDPRLAAMGVNYGTRALLPGPTATAVGITLIARVTTNGTFGNLGISAMGGGGSSSSPNSHFIHNDATSNTTTALWTSPALAFQRGNTAGTGTGRGLMSYTTAGGATSAVHNFRTLVPAGASGTSPTANAANPAPTDNPYNSGGSPASSGLYNGWMGANPAGTSLTGGVMMAMTAQRGTLADVDGTNPFADFSIHDDPNNPGTPVNGDADPSVAGNQSEWVALFHVLFVPRANNGGPNDVTRNVTVTFGGAFRYGISASFGAQVWTISSSDLSGYINAPITFQVPTPGAMALLGLGGLVAGRRRRA